MNANKMGRRKFLKYLAASTVVTGAAAHAQYYYPQGGLSPMQLQMQQQAQMQRQMQLEQIPPIPNGALEVTLMPDYQNHVVVQQTKVWCWAATLESIFSWYNQTVPQAEIVRRVWGAPMPQTSGDNYMLMGEVNRNFRIGSNIYGLQSKILSTQLGFSEITNADIVTALTNKRPCIVCTTTHMMVLIGVHYNVTPAGTTQLYGATMMDPFPDPQRNPTGIRAATLGELYLTDNGGNIAFLAIPQSVTAIAI